LSDKAQVFAAVSKMLGENGNVLCPGVQHVQLSSYILTTPQQRTSRLHERQEDETENKRYCAADFRDFRNSSIKKTHKQANHLERASTDKLLEQLNREMSIRNQDSKKSAEHQSDDNRCLIWHIPIFREKGRHSNWFEEGKWCSNCLRKFQISLDNASDNKAQ